MKKNIYFKKRQYDLECFVLLNVERRIILMTIQTERIVERRQTNETLLRNTQTQTHTETKYSKMYLYKNIYTYQ